MQKPSKRPGKKQHITDKKVSIEPKTAPVAEKPPVKKTHTRIYLLFLLFAFLLYGNTLVNEYALDDAIVITQNQFTKKGIAGLGDIFSSEYFTGFFGVKKNLVAGGRYRPFSLATFAIEYEFFGENPVIGHLINILLYALTCIILYKILLLLFRDMTFKFKWLTLPIVAVVLYMFHPIHTEVVANVKGRDELLSLLGALGAMYFAIRYLGNKNGNYLALVFIFFCMGMFSKESAITFLFTVPLAVWFFMKEHFTFRKMAAILSPMLTATLFYLAIRQNVLGPINAPVAEELMNDSFLGMTDGQKYATIFYTLGIYIKLIFFPHPLTFDYYPYHIPVMEWSDWQSYVSLILNLLLGVTALILLRRRHIISFALLFYFASLSPMSNVLFPIGVFMNERFVFVASFGFALIAGWFFTVWLPGRTKSMAAYKNIAVALLVVILGLYTVKTIARNTAWKNDFTLFTNDVKVSYNSAKSTCSAGGKLIEEATREGNEAVRDEYLKLAMGYLKKSVKIHPGYADAWLLLGNGYYEYRKDYDSVLWAYGKILEKNPNYERVWSNLEIVFARLDSTDYKIKVYESLLKINPNRFEPNYQLGVLWGKNKNNLANAFPYLKKAVQLNPKSTFALKDLGVAYGMAGMYDSSLVYLQQAVAIDPKDAQTMVNIGITYFNKGDTIKGREYFNKAKAADPSIKTP